MRDIGVFTSKGVSTEKLVEFVRSYALRAGQACEKRPKESVVGKPPHVIYVVDATEATNGYFGEHERQVIESRLGSSPEGYVSIHFTSTDAAFALAAGMAQEISRMWEGVVDYSGTGGTLGVSPTGPAG